MVKKKKERIGIGHPVIYFPNPKSSPGSSRYFRISPKQKATGRQDDRTIRQDDMTNRQDDTTSRQDDTENRHRVIFDPDTASLSGRSATMTIQQPVKTINALLETEARRSLNTSPTTSLILLRNTLSLAAMLELYIRRRLILIN